MGKSSDHTAHFCACTYELPPHSFKLVQYEKILYGIEVLLPGVLAPEDINHDSS